MTALRVIEALAGGALIGTAGLVLLLFHGRLAGVSGVVAGLVSPRTTHLAWRAAFLAGLVAGGLCAWLRLPSAFGTPIARSPIIWLAGGVLAGLGARISGGCTSGHGVCGIGRLSRRSLVATVTFMATAAGTVLIERILGGLS